MSTYIYQDEEKATLVTRITEIIEDYNWAKYEESQNNIPNEYCSQEDYEKNLKVGETLFTILLKDLSTESIKTKEDIMNFFSSYSSDLNELTNESRPGCDCGCGGDTMNWDWIYKRMEERDETMWIFIEKFITYNSTK